MTLSGIRLGFATLALGAVSTPALAALNGSATLTSTPLGGGDYHYDISIHNAGTTTVGTLWLSWQPDINFLTSEPVNLITPAGWIGLVTHNGLGDGYGIEFYTFNTSLWIHSGASLSGFSFETTDSPTVLSNNSPFYGGGYASLQSFLYIGFPENDPGKPIVAMLVPSPTSCGAVAFGASMLLRRRRRA